MEVVDSSGIMYFAEKWRLELDELDLVTMSRYLQQPGQRHKLVWDVNHRDNMYHEVEILPGLANEDDYKITKCYICDIDIPITFKKQHERSNKHTMNMKIINIALKRMMNHNENTSGEHQTNSIKFCDICSNIKTTDDHNNSIQHQQAIKQDLFLKYFLSFYEGMLKNSDLFTINENIIKAKKDDSFPSEDVKDNSENPLEIYFKKINIPNADIIVLNDSNIRIQSDNSTLDCHIDNFHGINRVRGIIQCNVCRVVVDDDDHINSDTHVNKVSVDLVKCCVRKLDGLFHHCILCNKVIGAVEFHLGDDVHVAFLKEKLALINSPNLDSQDVITEHNTESLATKHSDEFTPISLDANENKAYHSTNYGSKTIKQINASNIEAVNSKQINTCNDSNLDLIVEKTADTKHNAKDPKTVNMKQNFNEPMTANHKENVNDCNTADSKQNVSDSKNADIKQNVSDSKTTDTKHNVNGPKTVAIKHHINDPKTTDTKENVYEPKTVNMKQNVNDCNTAETKHNIKDSKTVDTKQNVYDPKTKTADTKENVNEPMTANEQNVNDSKNAVINVNDSKPVDIKQNVNDSDTKTSTKEKLSKASDVIDRNNVDTAREFVSQVAHDKQNDIIPSTSATNTNNSEIKTEINPPVLRTTFNNDYTFIDCEVCHVKLAESYRNIETHNKGRKHMYNLHRIMVENNIRKVDKYNTVCDLCNEYVYGEIQHVKGDKHINKIKTQNDNWKLQEESENCFVRTTNPKYWSCVYCDESVSSNENERDAHILTSSHIEKKNEKLNENHIRKSHGEYYCCLCAEDFPLGTALNHIESEKHNEQHVMQYSLL